MSQTRGNNSDRCEIGRIAGPHGVRGEVILVPLTDFPERFLDMESLDLETKGKPRKTYEIARISPYEGKGTFLVRLAGIESRNSAETLTGSSVTVSNDERVELEDGEFWIDDIVGISVLDESGTVLGTVTDVIFTGSNDVYVVKTPDGVNKAIPAIASVVKAVDVAGNTMTVVLPDGLWD